jgi:hypothetical protein
MILSGILETWMGKVKGAEWLGIVPLGKFAKSPAFYQGMNRISILFKSMNLRGK